MQHGTRVVGLMALAAALLGWLAGHTAVLFADGLRYIHQAQRIEGGALVDGLLRSVDHPAYPVAIAAVHGELGGAGPEDWQRAAQYASILAGVLLVIPTYLVALELIGPRAAWLAVVLTYLAPLSGHVLADALSEGTFLLFWTWGLWCALRFLKQGDFGWLPPTIGCSALAYLTRPEGLLLPAALVAALALMPLLRSTRLNWPRWWAAVGLLVIGPACLIGPYVAVKGGLGTKPAIARLLGTAPKSATDAVERQRPLDPDQSTLKTYGLATKAMFEAVRDATTLPLLILVPLGLWGCRPLATRARAWLLLLIVVAAACLALVRLHATGGYCTPRHAMVVAWLLIVFAAAGLDTLLRSVTLPARWLGMGEGRLHAGPAVWVLALAAFVAGHRSQFLAPLNSNYGGYRDAGRWLAEHVPAGERVVDLTGWALFYADRPGYTFANLLEAPADPGLRYIVVREAHQKGPWWYSKQIRGLIGDARPEAVFVGHAGSRTTRVYIYRRPGAPAVQSARAPTDGGLR